MGRRLIDVNAIRACFDSLPSRIRNKLFNDIYEEYYPLPGDKKVCPSSATKPLLQRLIERVYSEAGQSVRSQTNEKSGVWLHLILRLTKAGCVNAMPALYDQLVALVIEVIKHHEDPSGKVRLGETELPSVLTDALRAIVAVDLARRARPSTVQRSLARTLANILAASDANTAERRQQSPTGRTRIRYLALGALARLADNAMIGDVRSLVEPCLKDALPAALRAFASHAERVSVAGLLALRALAIGPPHLRGATQVGGSLAAVAASADALSEDALRTAAWYCDVDVLTVVVNAFRQALWDHHLRLRSERGGDVVGGGGRAEGGDTACETVARALAAVAQGLRGRTLPAHALRALQMTVATVAVEAEMLYASEGCPRTNAVFRATWRHILGLRRGLYPDDRLLEPSGSSGTTGCAETALRRLAPWKPQPHPTRTVALLGEREAARRATGLLRGVSDRLAAARAAARALAPTAVSSTDEITRRNRLCASCQRELTVEDKSKLIQDRQHQRIVCEQKTSTTDLHVKSSLVNSVQRVHHDSACVFEHTDSGPLKHQLKKDTVSRKREHGDSVTTGTTDTE